MTTNEPQRTSAGRLHRPGTKDNSVGNGGRLKSKCVMATTETRTMDHEII